MSYLQCPECRLTVPAAAYYLRGDECPRCLSTMERRATFRPEAEPVKPPAVPLALPSSGAGAPASPGAG